MQRRISEPRRQEVPGEWSKIHIENVKSLYFSHLPITRMMKTRRDKMDVTCSADGDIINTHKISVCKSTWKRPPEKHGYSCKNLKCCHVYE
jgi:hypothetical protein